MVSQREKKLSQIVKKWGRKGRGEYEIYCQLPRCTLHAEKIYKIYWLYQVYLAKGSHSGKSLYRYFTDPNPLYCTFSWVFYAKWPLFWLFILFSSHLWVKKIIFEIEKSLHSHWTCWGGLYLKRPSLSMKNVLSW